MRSYIENSLAYRFISWSILVYRSSCLNRFMETLGRWTENSTIYKGIIRYFNRKSFAENSVFYRILSFMGKKLDIHAGKIHTKLASAINSSKVKTLIDTLKTESGSNPNALLLTALVTFLSVYALVTSILGTWNTARLLYISVLGIICLLLIIPVKTLKGWVLSSRIYKVLHYIWE
ncbi:MAG: hypothetical protein N3I35_14285 [Clostridia bacterium]|nr:hypothetical protein [Clostridia bacterium]